MKYAPIAICILIPLLWLVSIKCNEQKAIKEASDIETVEAYNSVLENAISLRDDSIAILRAENNKLKTINDSLKSTRLSVKSEGAKRRDVIRKMDSSETLKVYADSFGTADPYKVALLYADSTKQQHEELVICDSTNSNLNAMCAIKDSINDMHVRNEAQKDSISLNKDTIIVSLKKEVTKQKWQKRGVIAAFVAYVLIRR